MLVQIKKWRAVISAAGATVDEAGKASVSAHLAGGPCFTRVFGDALNVQLIFPTFNVNIFLTRIRQYISDNFENRNSTSLDRTQGFCVESFRCSTPPPFGDANKKFEVKIRLPFLIWNSSEVALPIQALHPNEATFEKQKRSARLCL